MNVIAQRCLATMAPTICRGRLWTERAEVGEVVQRRSHRPAVVQRCPVVCWRTLARRAASCRCVLTVGRNC